MKGKGDCGKAGKHSHSMKGVIDGIYSMKGENYLSPNQKTMNFWGTELNNKKGGKN